MARYLYFLFFSVPGTLQRLRIGGAVPIPEGGTKRMGQVILVRLTDVRPPEGCERQAISLAFEADFLGVCFSVYWRHPDAPNDTQPHIERIPGNPCGN